VIALGVYGGHVLVQMDAESARQAAAAEARRTERAEADAKRVERAWAAEKESRVAPSRPAPSASEIRGKKLAEVRARLARAAERLEHADRGEGGIDPGEAKRDFDSAAWEAQNSGDAALASEAATMRKSRAP
jgi:hypothetical protein